VKEREREREERRERERERRETGDNVHRFPATRDR
jgi:hypothetical protein